MKGQPWIVLHQAQRHSPLYLDVASSVRQSITSGILKPGQRVPSSRALAEQWGIHRLTVMNGLDILVAEGYLIAEERKALRVADTLPDSLLKPKQPPTPQGAAKAHRWRLVRKDFTSTTIGHQSTKGGIGFYSGLPDLREFPIKEFHSFVRDAIQHHPVKKLRYSFPEGHPPFLVELGDYLAQVRTITQKKVIVTHGSQEAIFLVAQLLLGHGDQVAVEGLGYRPAWEAFLAAGAEICHVPLQQGVMDLEFLEQKCRSGVIRLIYVTPLHQYPTTTTLSIPDRARLYEIAMRYQIPLLEDDYDHEFHYDTQPFAPMAASDPGQLILYCSTFSKILYPSARLGFVAVPETIFDPLNSLRRVLTRQNDCWLQDAVALWMKDGGFSRHLRRMRKLYESRRNLLHELLSAAAGRGLEIQWNLPSGGMSIWLNTHRDSDALAKNLELAGVHISPESHFRPGKIRGTHVRLGYACLNEKEIRAGTRILLAEIEKLKFSRNR